MSDTGNDNFLSNVFESFDKVRLEDGAILLVEYVNAYEAIIKFFNSFGRLFSFITADVKQKIEILRHHLREDTGKYYQNVQSMLEYEVENNITTIKGSTPSGSRTLLRLHRALDFIRLFFMRLSTTERNDKVSAVAADCYNQTLANFHPWLVRKATSLAMYALPSRATLLSNFQDNSNSEEDILLSLQKIATVISPIYNDTEELYTEYNLHSLP